MPLKPKDLRAHGIEVHVPSTTTTEPLVSKGHSVDVDPDDGDGIVVAHEVTDVHSRRVLHVQSHSDEARIRAAIDRLPPE